MECVRARRKQKHECRHITYKTKMKTQKAATCDTTDHTHLFMKCNEDGSAEHGQGKKGEGVGLLQSKPP